MTLAKDSLPIGYIAERSGVSVATLRFYEEAGLIQPSGRVGSRRVFGRHVLRRLAFIAAAQRVGLSIAEIRAAMTGIPVDRAPSPAEWDSLSEPWKARIDLAIAGLESLRTSLDGCIGCGCLSMRTCGMLNPGDEAATEGAGSRWLRGVTRARVPQ
ncbi:redox-sensitive transcriptional activator SoxR [Arthrobacter sp. CAN_A1]|uniref:redox-sensitive transcriptional activator SoxR n=1 Tax=Arthrobacter sp. CAN_A1 TaxID=2787717 RepID=UPI0018C967A7